MTYKIYKITEITKGNIQNYIKFGLDDYVEFSNGNHNFVFCVNQSPFTSYRMGDEIEINLTDAKQMSSQSYHQEIIRKTSRSYAGGYYDDYIPQSDINRDPREVLMQGSITLSAYETEAVYDFLYGALEWLELYIEKANYYPNWQQKKQLPKTITRPDIPYLDAKETKEHFLTSLSGLKAISTGKPSFLLEKLQTEFFSWLDSSGIGVNSCPAELIQSLADFHSILIGKAGEFTKRRRKEIDENIAKMTSEEKQKNFSEIVATYQEPLENEDKVFEAMKGKTYKDVNTESKFNGNADQGKEKFELIKKQLEIPQQRTNSEIIQDVVRDKNRVWRIDDVIIYQNGIKHLIKALIKNSVRIEYDETGYPLFNAENMYQESKFNEEEKTEINQALGISQTSTSKKYYQKNQSDSKKVDNPTTPNSNNNTFGTIAIIASILALASLGIYGIVKKSKKVKSK